MERRGREGAAGCAQGILEDANEASARSERDSREASAAGLQRAQVRQVTSFHHHDQRVLIVHAMNGGLELARCRGVVKLLRVFEDDDMVYLAFEPCMKVRDDEAC